MMDDDYYEDDPDDADYWNCVAIVKEARRTGQTDGIVEMLGRPLSPIERKMLAELLSACQLKSKRGRPTKLWHDRDEDRARAARVVNAYYDLRREKVPAAKCIEKVSKRLGMNVGVVKDILKRNKFIPF